MSKQITFESAHAAALEVRPAVGGPAVYLKFIAKMSRLAARSMDAEYAIYGTDSLPKPGWTKMDSDFQVRNVGLVFEVKSMGKGPKEFRLELKCPLVDKFVFVRVGSKKKGKNAYVACKARALVDGALHHALEFLLKAGAADGVLTLEPHDEPQIVLPLLEVAALLQHDPDARVAATVALQPLKENCDTTPLLSGEAVYGEREAEALSAAGRAPRGARGLKQSCQR